MSKKKFKIGDLCKVCTATNFDDKVRVVEILGDNIKVEVIESYYGLKPGDIMTIYKYSLKALFEDVRRNRVS
jgi:hypothetical protein